MRHSLSSLVQSLLLGSAVLTASLLGRQVVRASWAGVGAESIELGVLGLVGIVVDGLDAELLLALEKHVLVVRGAYP